jgi:hypothetical protein
MVADGLLTRQRYREVPPRVDYELTERARELMPVIGALARWGYEWTWSSPRAGEAVNIGAILRTAPGLLELPSGAEGTVELQVSGDRGGERSYVLTLHEGQATISEQPAEDADAHVTGSVKAWVRALGPTADAHDLSFSGDRGLADAVLDGFMRAATASAATAAA